MQLTAEVVSKCLRVEGEDRLLVASDEESWRHSLGHHVQPGGVQGGAGVASLGQRQGHHDQPGVGGVLSQHLCQSEVPAHVG